LAKAIGVSPRFIYKLIRAGKLTAYKVGDRTIILPEDAQKLLRAEPMGVVGTPQDQEGASVSVPIGAVAKASEATEPMAIPAEDSAEPCSITPGTIQ